MTGLNTGQRCTIAGDAEVGVGHREKQTVLGDGATIRSGTIIYRGVEIGDNLTTGHNVLVRSGTTIGDDVLLGTDTVLDGEVTVGSDVSFQTGTYIPQETTIGDHVFVGPHAVVTNDPYPVRETSTIEETCIEDHASIGANATLLPGITVGEGAFVAAGAVVTEDVPPETLAVGTPAEHKPLPETLTGGNQIQ